MGKSGGSAPTEQRVTSTNIPEYARPYVEDTLGRAQALTTGSTYQPYAGQRVAGFSPMEAQAFQDIAGQQVAPQIADASNMALGAGQAATGYGQQAAGFGQQAAQLGQQAAAVSQAQAGEDRAAASRFGGQASSMGLAGITSAQQAQQAAERQADVYGQSGMTAGARGEDIGARGVSAAEQGFGAQQAYQQMATSPQAMQAYMSPYMQNVVDVQQQEAIRQADIARQARQAQAVGQGAYGGSRQAVAEAEAQRNLATQLGRIQAEGQQRAFEQAQQAQQFGAGLGIQGLQAGLSGLRTGMEGTGQAIQGANLGLQGTAQRLAAGQLGLQGVRTGLEGQQLGLAGTQASTQAGRFGLQGLQTGVQGAQAAIGAAGQLGGLGAQQFEQQMAITDAMQKYGALQQAQRQQGLDVAYQDYLAQQNFPYQQIGYFSDIIRGLPMSQSSQTMYGGQPSLAAQLPGLALAGAGYFGGQKEGGQVKKYAEGGSVSAEALSVEDVMGMRSKLRRLSDSQLAAYARVVKDAITLSAVQNEIDRRAKMRQPGAAAPESTTAEGIAQRAEAASVGQPRVGMAGGGIVALKNGGDIPAFSNGGELDVLNRQIDDIRAELGRPDLPADVRTGLRGRLDELVGKRAAATTSPTSTEKFLGGLGSAYESRLKEAGIEPTPADPAARTTSGFLKNLGEAMQSGQYPTGTTKASDQENLNQLMNLGEPDRTLPLSEGQQQQQQQQQGQGRSGIMRAGAGVPRFSTFEQFRSMLPKGEIDPAQQKILDDMQKRLMAQTERAEGQQDRAIYDAMLTAGLAMMGGNSLADGIARAAQAGGATYMASKKDAAKAIDAAEKAEIAFRKYELDVMKGNEKEAREEFGAFLDYTADLAAIDARYAAIGAGAGATSGLDPKDVSLIRGRVEKQVNDRYGNIMPANEIEAAQLEADKRNLRNSLLRSYGISPIAQGQTTGGSQQGMDNRPALSSFAK